MFIVILYSIKTTTIIGQASTLTPVLGALHVLSHLSSTTSLWVRSYQFHFSKRRLGLWRIHVDIWQNQYNILKLKNKKNKLVYLKFQSPLSHRMGLKPTSVGLFSILLMNSLNLDGLVSYHVSV